MNKLAIKNWDELEDRVPAHALVADVPALHTLLEHALGQAVQLVAGHAYAPGGIGGDRQTGTGGAGSSQYPTDGMWQSITFNGLAGFYSAQVAAGGGGAPRRAVDPARG